MCCVVYGCRALRYDIWLATSYVGLMKYLGTSIDFFPTEIWKKRFSHDNILIRDCPDDWKSPLACLFFLNKFMERLDKKISKLNNKRLRSVVAFTSASGALKAMNEGGNDYWRREKKTESVCGTWLATGTCAVLDQSNHVLARVATSITFGKDNTHPLTVLFYWSMERIYTIIIVRTVFLSNTGNNPP